MFAALAFNCKVLIDFTYNTGASSLFRTPGGDSNPTALLAEKTDGNRRARNLGRALVRLKPVDDAPGAYTTSMMFVRGRNANGTPNPIPIGFRADPESPNNYSDWAVDRNDPYLRGWAVTNVAGTVNGGQIGDVIISWFKPLDESFDGPSYTNHVYLMIVNGLSSSTGSAADCLQDIRLNFAFPAGMTGLLMLNATTGAVETNTLPVVSSRRQLALRLNGGDAALFKFATGAPFVGEPQSARLGVQVQTNTPSITITGAVSARYRLEATDTLPNNAWTVLTNVILPASPYVFTDVTSTGLAKRFYRAVGLQ
jgi:hypothetical protein